ncbi:hypothetical protein BH10BAC4_BH10BAC4_21510 [soil metagenome]
MNDVDFFGSRYQFIFFASGHTNVELFNNSQNPLMRQSKGVNASTSAHRPKADLVAQPMKLNFLPKVVCNCADAMLFRHARQDCGSCASEFEPQASPYYIKYGPPCSWIGKKLFSPGPTGRDSLAPCEARCT